MRVNDSSASTFHKLFPIFILVLIVPALVFSFGCKKKAENWIVTFEDEGKIIETVEIEASDSGVLVDCPAVSDRDGYTFAGWESASPDDPVTIYKPASGKDLWTARVHGDGVHLHPVWSGVFTVTYTDGEGNELKSFTVNDGDELPTIDDPKREGYVFAGWDNAPKVVHENLTISATWKEVKKWTVTYTDGQDNVLETFQVEDGGTVPKIDDPKRDGYVFTGWDSLPQNAYADITINATLDKIWTVKYTDGDGNVLATFQVNDGEAVPTIDAPTREGYVFEGWDSSATTVTEDLTINAKWKKLVTWKVVFTDGEGKTIDEQTVVDGEDAKAPEDPKRDGYIFDGWDGDFKKVTKDLTINAKWKIDETEGMKDALRLAKEYVAVIPFSYEGLVKQLEFEKYTHDEAVYAADNCGADWNEQAVKAAKAYMDIAPLSREELLDQLEYDGFTPEQAKHGADSVF